MSQDSARGNIPLKPTDQYGYVPTLWICITFVTLFALTTVVHLGQALFIKPRLYWLIPTNVMCGVGEIIGWSGRLWSSKNPINRDAYLMQITTTIISPVFLTAALYTIFGLIVAELGTEYSRIKSKTYVKIFVTADILALVVQAAGGGLASSADTDSGEKLGSNIMVAGIFLQMIAMIIYVALATEYLIRYYMRRPLHKVASPPASPDYLDKFPNPNKVTRTSLMVFGLYTATVLVFIRTFYRTVELLGGWRGHIIRTQIYFDVLDATPVFLALFILNVFSPSLLLRPRNGRAARN